MAQKYQMEKSLKQLERTNCEKNLANKKYQIYSGIFLSDYSITTVKL